MTVLTWTVEGSERGDRESPVNSKRFAVVEDFDWSVRVMRVSWPLILETTGDDGFMIIAYVA